MKQRILILGTYPLYPAIHGGQKRTTAIIEKYRQLGHEVRYVSVCTPGNYTHYSRDDFRVGERVMQSLSNLPSLTFTELITCQLSSQEAKVTAKLKEVIRSFKPTIIEYEQGYVYALTKTLEEYLGISNTRVLFSSHNVEWQMKRDIALSEGCTPEEIEPYVSKIRDIEIELITKASYTIAVSDTDVAVYKEFVEKGSYLIARNGISPIHATVAAKASWKKFLDSRKIEHTAVFVASAHPPNLHGFRSLIDGVGFLGFYDRVVVAGGVADMLKALTKKTSDIQLATLRNRVILVGRLSEARLQGLLATADVIILPVLEGGGSNLKTAEAIISNKPVVATTHAFRSYEDFTQLPNIYIADDAIKFQTAINKAFTEPFIERNEKQKVMSQAVLWDTCLTPLEAMFEEGYSE